jgi:hypothetical protein
MGLPAIACPSAASCTAVGGYENDGPDSVTLAEQWRGGDSSSTALAPSEAAASARTCPPPLVAVGAGQAMQPAQPWRRLRLASLVRVSAAGLTLPVRCYAG